MGPAAFVATEVPVILTPIRRVAPPPARSPNRLAGRITYPSPDELHDVPVQVQVLVTGTVNEPHTTIADFNALPGHRKAAMTQGSLRNAMTAIEEIIMLSRQGIAMRQ